jgi:hypothetical protein
MQMPILVSRQEENHIMKNFLLYFWVRVDELNCEHVVMRCLATQHGRTYISHDNSSSAKFSSHNLFHVPTSWLPQPLRKSQLHGFP